MQAKHNNVNMSYDAVRAVEDVAKNEPLLYWTQNYNVGFCTELDTELGFFMALETNLGLCTELDIELGLVRSVHVGQGPICTCSRDN